MFTFPKFLLIQVGLTLAALSGAYAYQLYGGSTYSLWLHLSAVLMPSVLTMIGFAMGSAGIRKKSNGMFMNLLLGGLMLKLFLSILFILVVLLVVKGKPIGFVVIYFLSYFLFTGFEVYALFQNLKASNKPA